MSSSPSDRAGAREREPRDRAAPRCLAPAAELQPAPGADDERRSHALALRSPEDSALPLAPPRRRPDREAKIEVERQPKRTDEPTGLQIHCARCSHPLTSAALAREVDGAHEHARINPIGITYRFRCFHAAPGGVVSGHPTHADSWFPGFAWRFVHCGGCQVHLGWAFSEGGGDAFFGLVSERLREE